jgi:hypothetical protein
MDSYREVAHVRSRICSSIVVAISPGIEVDYTPVGGPYVDPLAYAIGRWAGDEMDLAGPRHVLATSISCIVASTRAANHAISAAPWRQPKAPCIRSDALEDGGWWETCREVGERSRSIGTCDLAEIQSP